MHGVPMQPHDYTLTQLRTLYSFIALGCPSLVRGTNLLVRVLPVVSYVWVCVGALRTVQVQ
jgi:hypothetical protein